jgi:hypothetical protein
MAFSSATSGSPHLLSRPLQVEWAGLTSDTYRLQQAGWQLSAQQQTYDGRMSLMMMHPGVNMRAMSQTIDFDYVRAREDWHHYLPTLRFNMQHMAREINIHAHGQLDWDFSAIDAKPCISHRSIQRMEDLAHFAPPLVRCNEVIIPEESVPELMQKILKLQQPARTDRIKEQMRNPEGFTAVPQQKFQAQIISLAA